MAAPETPDTSKLRMTLRGNGDTLRPAERALLTLKVESPQSTSEEEASAATVATANAVRDILSLHCPQDEATGRTLPEAGVVHYSMSTLDTKAHYPRARDGASLDPYFVATAEFVIKFRDFALVNKLATQFSATKNIKISRMDWKLTDQTYNSTTTEIRRLAAEDAIQRAYDYAEVFAGVPREQCKSRVLPYEIDEAHYYSQDTRPQLHFGKGSRGTKVDSRDLQFSPEDVRVSASVTAKFVVSV